MINLRFQVSRITLCWHQDLVVPGCDLHDTSPTLKFLSRPFIAPACPHGHRLLLPSLYAPLSLLRVHASGEGHDRGVFGDGVHRFLREAHSHSDKQHHHGRISLER